MAKKYLIRFSIKDSEGNHKYDYSVDFLVELQELMPGTKAEFEKAQFTMFKEKIVAAVKDWFADDPDAVKDEIDQFGYGYDFDADDCKFAEDYACEEDYAVDNFPARCVAHIPDVIMKRNGFELAPEPTMEHEFYNDYGFLRD